jgi:hypothetical protein
MSPKKTPAKKAAKKTSAKPKNDLTAAFSALCGLLAPYEDVLARKTPDPGYSYLESRTPTYKNRPMFFAAVRAGKNYVSYHLMPVAVSSELHKTMSPGLKKYIGGKACFRFSAVEEPLLAELGKLTRAGYEKFKNLKYL